MAYRLYYWKLRGRGEQVRLLLCELGQTYEDVYVAKDRDFPVLRAEGAGTLAFGSVPMLQDGAFKLVQGPAIMNYLARKHRLAPKGIEDDARAEAMVLGAEDMRMAYFRTLRDDPRAQERRERFVTQEWHGRWLPAWDGLLELNEDNGYLLGSKLCQADIAVWDAIDAIVNYVDGADFSGFPRVHRFYTALQERPAIRRYLDSDRRIGNMT